MKQKGETILYKVTIQDPKTHYCQVDMQVKVESAGDYEFKLPTWLPGAYRINDFAKNIDTFVACDECGNSLSWEKTDKQTWVVSIIQPCTIHVSYYAYSFKLQDDMTYICTEFAIVNPGSILLAAMQFMKNPCRIELRIPEHWERISTGLTRPDKNEPVFNAQDYHETIDCPILLGNHAFFTFTVDGRQHEVAIEGRGNMDTQQFVEDLERIAKVEIEMMGHIPYQRYVFLILLSNADAGLEHRNSTLIFTRRFDYVPREKYLQTMTIFAHELFHAWNVKALRPRPLIEPDYFSETYTGLLWFSEGFTNYYHQVFMHRAGVQSLKEFLDNWGKIIFRYRMTPGRNYQSAYEASFDSWIKYYQPDENTNNTSISYYLKGSLIGLYLDLFLMKETNGKYHMDDVIKQLYHQNYLLAETGFTYRDFVSAMNSFLGRDASEELHKLVYSKGDISLEDSLSWVGLDLVPKNKETKDGYAPGGFLGVTIIEKDHRLFVRTVQRGSPAENGGLQPMDEILAINGFRIAIKAEFDSRLSELPENAQINFLIARNEEIMERQTTLATPTLDGYQIKMKDNASELEKQLFGFWTGAAFDELKDEPCIQNTEKAKAPV